MNHGQIQIPPDGEQCVARTFADAPEIDCEVRIPGTKLESGQFADVRIKAVVDLDLLAEPVGTGVATGS